MPSFYLRLLTGEVINFMFAIQLDNLDFFDGFSRNLLWILFN